MPPPVPAKVSTDRHEGRGGYRPCPGAPHVLQIGGFRVTPCGDGEEESMQHLTQLEGVFDCVVRPRLVRGRERDQPRRGSVVDQAGVPAPARKIGIGRQEVLGRVAGAVLDRIDEIEAEPPPEQAQLLEIHPCGVIACWPFRNPRRPPADSTPSLMKILPL